jgi:hypothetical protein
VAENIAADVLAAQRRERAIELRVKGAHWSEISSACGYPSPAAALADVGRAMADATRRAEETADMMRDTANLRLESLLRSTLDILDEDSPERYDDEGNSLFVDDRPVKLRAVDEARRLVADITRLNGVDKPEKTEGEGEGALTIRITGLDASDLV